MKSFYQTILLTGAAVAALFAVAAPASAQTYTGSGQPPTIQIINATRNPGCNFAQCGSTSVTASAGDTISVQIFYRNTGTVSGNANLRLSPQTAGPTNSVTFTGGVNGVTGSATVSISGVPQTVTYAGTGRWYPNWTASGQSGSYAQVFGSGFDAGTVAPQYGGNLVLDFIVGTTAPAPTVYACNDGIDNDGDGLIDMNDPGCSSPTDNDEYNPPAQPVSVSLYASPSSLAAAGSTTLTWYAQNATSCTGNFGNIYGASGSSTVYLSSTSTYTVHCTNGHSSNSATTTVFVNQHQQPVPVYGCTDRAATNFNPYATVNSGCVYGSQGTLPSVSTTVASQVSQTAARLNGVASANGYGTTAWFEWGQTTSLGYTTAQTSIGTANTYPTAEQVSNLAPGTVYFFRAVAQNQYGVSRGDIQSFRTLSVSNPIVVDDTPRVIIRDRIVQVPIQGGTTTPSLLAIRIENASGNACVANVISYTVRFQNVSGKTVSDAVLQVVFPRDISFSRSSAGVFDAETNTLTVNVGTVAPNEAREFQVSGTVGRSALNKDFVVTARMLYTNPTGGAQEDVLAYSFERGTACAGFLGASALFSGGFFPNTLIGWLLLILIIILLVLAGRTLYERSRRNRNEPLL